MIDKRKFNAIIFGFQAYGNPRRANDAATALYELAALVLHHHRIVTDPDIIQVIVTHTYAGIGAARDPFAWAWSTLYRKALNELDKDTRRNRRFPLYDPHAVDNSEHEDESAEEPAEYE